MLIRAKSKYLDLKNNFTFRHLYSVIGFVIVLCLIAVIIFAWIRDWLISLTFIACAFVGYVIFTQSAKEFNVEIQEDCLVIDQLEYKFTDLVSWAVIDLGDTLEVVVRSKNYGSPFMYFYILDNTAQTSQFIKMMRSNLPYDAEMPKNNYIHRLLRVLNLK